MWNVHAVCLLRIRSQVVTTSGCKASCGSSLRHPLLFHNQTFSLWLYICIYTCQKCLLMQSKFFHRDLIIHGQAYHLLFHHEPISLCVSVSKHTVDTDQSLTLTKQSKGKSTKCFFPLGYACAGGVGFLFVCFTC